MSDPLFTFEEKSHAYKYDGKRMTGVTTIIGVLAKPALIGWAARMAVEYVKEHSDSEKKGTDDFWTYSIKESDLDDAKNAHTKKKEAAGMHGTDTHALVEDYIKQSIEDNEGRPHIGAFDKWLPIRKFIQWSVENVDHFLFSERRMFNKDMFIAGTADFGYVGKDGNRYMADFKTSSGIFGIDFWLQTAAYRMLAEGEGDEPYDGCVVVRMGKDGSFEVLRLFDYETCKNAFLSCLNIYRAQANLKNLAVK